MQGQEVPEFITKSTRHFSNLFEVPTLFYAGGAVYLALGLDSRLAVACAWAFVVARTLHTFTVVTLYSRYLGGFDSWSGGATPRHLLQDL
jgi:hypothetical protein